MRNSYTPTVAKKKASSAVSKKTMASSKPLIRRDKKETLIRDDRSANENRFLGSDSNRRSQLDGSTDMSSQESASRRNAHDLEFEKTLSLANDGTTDPGAMSSQENASRQNAKEADYVKSLVTAGEEQPTLYKSLMERYGAEGLTDAEALAIIAGEKEKESAYVSEEVARTKPAQDLFIDSSNPDLGFAPTYYSQDAFNNSVTDQVNAYLRSKKENELLQRYEADPNTLSPTEMERVATLQNRQGVRGAENTLASAAGDALQGWMRDVAGSDAEGTYNGNSAMQAADFTAGTLANLPGGILSLVPKVPRIVGDVASGTSYRNGEFVGMTPQEQLASMGDLGLDIASLVPIGGTAMRGARALGSSAARSATKESTAKTLLKNLGREGLETALPESLIEGMQTGLEAASEGREASPEEILQGAAGGAIGGAAFGGISAGAQTAGQVRANRSNQSAIKAMDKQLVALLEQTDSASLSTGTDSTSGVAKADASALVQKVQQQALASQAAAAAPQQTVAASPNSQLETQAGTQQVQARAQAMMQEAIDSNNRMLADIETREQQASQLEQAQPQAASAARYNMQAATDANTPDTITQGIAENGEAKSALMSSRAAASPTAEATSANVEPAVTSSYGNLSLGDAKTQDAITKAVELATTISKSGGGVSPSARGKITKAMNSYAKTGEAPATGKEMSASVVEGIQNGTLKDASPQVIVDYLYAKFAEPVLNEHGTETDESSEARAAFDAAEPDVEVESDTSSKEDTPPVSEKPKPKGKMKVSRSKTKENTENPRLYESKSVKEVGDEFQKKWEAMSPVEREAWLQRAEKGDYQPNPEEMRRIRKLNKRDNLGYDTKRLHDIDQAARSSLAQKMRMGQEDIITFNKRILKGEPSADELYQRIEDTLFDLAGMKITPEIEAELELLTQHYEKVSEARKDVDIAATNVTDIVDDPRAKDVRDQLIQSTKELRDVRAAIHSFVVTKIQEQHKGDKAKQKELIYEYKKKQGIYLHNWVDSSLLSSIAGRAFDQLNAWTVVAEEMDPVTKAINTAFVKYNVKRGKDVSLARGAAGISSIPLGAKQSAQKITGNKKERKSFRGEGRHPGGVLTDTTAFVVEMGDIGISSLSHSYGMKYYLESKPGISKTQAEILTITDPDKVMDVFENIAYAEQGLGTQNLAGMVQWINSIVSAGLKKTPIFKRHADTIATAVNRTIAGFWNVTKRVALRGGSRATFGVFKGLNAYRKVKNGSLKEAQAMAEYRRALIDAKSGLEFVGLGAALNAAGILTGPYPEDDEERALWEAEGRQPWSIRIGDFYWEIPRLFGVFAMPLMVGASMQNAMANNESLEDGIADLTKALFDAAASSSSANSIVDNFTALANAAKGQVGDALQSLFGSFTKMFVPLSSLQNQIYGVTDPYQRDTSVPRSSESGWAEWVADYFAGIFTKTAAVTPARYMLPVKTDSFSNLLANNPLKIFGSNGMVLGEDDPKVQEARRLHDKELFVFPGNNRSYVYDDSGKRIKLDTWDQVAVDAAVDLNRTANIQQLLDSERYAGATDEEKAEMWAQVLKDNEKAVTAQVLDSLGVKTYDEANTPLDYGEGLSDEDKEALHTYDMLDESMRASWLDDNENAYNYYRANFNNKKLLGQLTDRDMDLRYGSKDSAYYRYLEAKLNYEYDIPKRLQNQYRDIGLTEWRELWDEDPELAQKLYDYDTLRTEAGVSRHGSDHSERKYYLKEGSSGYGYGGGRSGGGGGSARYHVPSVSDLSIEQYFPKGSKYTVSETVNRPSVAPTQLENKVPTVAKGKGVKTTPKTFQGASTIKYEKSKTRQPAMGTPYMEYLNGRSAQDSFKAQRDYRS